MCRQQDLAALDSSKVGSERNDLPTRPRRDLVKLSGGHLARFQLSAGDINLATIDRKTFRDHAADAYGATGHKRDLVRHTKHFGYTQTIVAVGVILAGRLGILCAYIKNMAGGKVSAVQRHKRRAKDNSSCSSIRIIVMSAGKEESVHRQSQQPTAASTGRATATASARRAKRLVLARIFGMGQGRRGRAG